MFYLLVLLWGVSCTVKDYIGLFNSKLLFFIKKECFLFPSIMRKKRLNFAKNSRLYIWLNPELVLKTQACKDSTPGPADQQTDLQTNIWPCSASIPKALQSSNTPPCRDPTPDLGELQHPALQSYNTRPCRASTSGFAELQHPAWRDPTS